MFKENYHAEVFDIFFEAEGDPFPPTEESIAEISRHFDIEFPASFISFCSKAKYYREWFCSVGENYDQISHIIRENSLYKNTRRRTGKNSCYENARNSKNEKWVSVKSASHIVIRAGHDDHCLVLDTSNRTSVDEFGIQYWFPGYENEFGDSYTSFVGYVSSLLEYMYNEASQEKRNQVVKFLKGKD